MSIKLVIQEVHTPHGFAIDLLLKLHQDWNVEISDWETRHVFDRFHNAETLDMFLTGVTIHYDPDPVCLNEIHHWAQRVKDWFESFEALLKNPQLHIQEIKLVPV